MKNSGRVVPDECLVPCVYSRDGHPGDFFCFKSGSLPVSCTGSGKLEGPFGDLVNANTPFSEKVDATAAITKITIFTGKYNIFDNVVVGIQTTYGSGSPQIVRGREGNHTTVCSANPQEGIYFSQITGRKLNQGDTQSIIYQLGFRNNNGADLCSPPLSGIEQGDRFTVPAQPSRTNDIKYFEGNTTNDNMLGSLSFFTDTITNYY